MSITSTSRRLFFLFSLIALGCGPKGGATDAEGTPAEEGTTADEETTADFHPAEDTLVEAEICEPFGESCPEGEKCVPYSESGSSWGHKCVPVMGEGAPGDPCWSGGAELATDNCDATSTCWNTYEANGELVGTCYPLCGGTLEEPECPSTWSCLVSAADVILCLPGCDPLEQDCSSPKYGCYWNSDQFICAFSPLNLPTGAACGYINDCAPGHICTEAEMLPSCDGVSCCSPFCHLEMGDEQCDGLPGTSCVALFGQGEAPPDKEHVGMCAAL